MEHYKDSFIKKEFVFPVLVALIGVVILSVFFGGYLNNLPFLSKTSNNISSGELVQIESVSTDNVVSKSQLPTLSANNSIGSIAIGNSTHKIVYNPSYKNSASCYTLNDSSILFGETGNVTISCNKSMSSEVKKLSKGDNIVVDTFYGKYQYTVINTNTVAHKEQIPNNTRGYDSTLTLYAPASDSPGISDSCFVAFCNMTDGKPVTE